MVALQQRAFAVGQAVKVLAGALLFLWVFFGCATVDRGARVDLLEFLKVGRTTRAEVLVNLGEPSGQFQQENILTYRIGGDAEKGYVVVWKDETGPGATGRDSLVLEM